MGKAIAWTIAGSDSGGGAGIQADLQAFRSFDVHGCSVVTAVTAQNTKMIDDVEWISANNVAAQLRSLQSDIPAKAIKLSMIAHTNLLEIISSFLQNFTGATVYDPVLVSTTGQHLSDVLTIKQLTKTIIPYCDLITPNLFEAQTILNWDSPLDTPLKIKKAAYQLLEIGVTSVLIKGGHGSNKFFSQDFFTDGKQEFWLTADKQLNGPYHGSGCTLSAAITACLAKEYSLLDALVIAKAYVSQGLRLSETIGAGLKPVAHHRWPENCSDLPWMSISAEQGTQKIKFPDCGDEALGFYPIVDSVEWMQRLLPLGIQTIQLRIKDQENIELENEIKKAILLARQYDVRLFINDYWELALKYKAYGVHLGQEDLLELDYQALLKSGLRLGVSTHCYSEVSRAHAYGPSYIAVGPIYETYTKKMNFLPQGLHQLKFWCKTLPYPIVAIGGIGLDQLAPVYACGVNGIAVISAITKANDLERAVQWGISSCKKE